MKKNFLVLLVSGLKFHVVYLDLLQKYKPDKFLKPVGFNIDFLVSFRDSP